MQHGKKEKGWKLLITTQKQRVYKEGLDRTKPEILNSRSATFLRRKLS
jgi:hypothetical protein